MPITSALGRKEPRSSASRWTRITEAGTTAPATSRAICGPSAPMTHTRPCSTGYRRVRLERAPRPQPSVHGNHARTAESDVEGIAGLAADRRAKRVYDMASRAGQPAARLEGAVGGAANPFEVLPAAPDQDLQLDQLAGRRHVASEQVPV